eukprot:12369788-Karenia_brevis.AAC.1
MSKTGRGRSVLGWSVPPDSPRRDGVEVSLVGRCRQIVQDGAGRSVVGWSLPPDRPRRGGVEVSLV